MSENKITMIQVDKLHPHPDNPRKNVGDVSELAESIKKNGVLQNLTVVPLGNTAEEYTVIIGHRRLAAAKEAGLDVLPCVIVDMTPQEQFHTMLTENMQRTDLTPMEQAQGFQIMFDWGYSEKDIAEKTGFSETTVRHRLNMAKLSTKAIEKYEKNNGFQLSLSDYYALEKVPTLKEKNEILRTATSSRDIQTKATEAEVKARRDKAADKIIRLLKKSYTTIEEFPKKERVWDSKWEKLKSIDLDKPVPDKIPIGKAKKGEQLYYYRWYSDIEVHHKKPKQAKEPQDEYEKARKEKEKRGKQITAKLKAMSARARDFILAVIDGKIDDLPASDTEAIKDEIWKQILENWSTVRYDAIYDFLAGCNILNLSEQEREPVKQKARDLCALHQMLIVLHENLKGIEPFDYNKFYIKQKGEQLKAYYSLLERYGWSYEDDEEAILDGTHELYTKPAAESDKQD